MLIKPSLEKLLLKVDSKFSLITMVSKRVRQFNTGWEPMIDVTGMKPVTAALNEIVEGKISMKAREEKEG